ncbi:hypothetical protein [Kamptonema formosum]|nr:hypothetical protein [Oscillatoria sp. PCC 10802]
MEFLERYPTGKEYKLNEFAYNIIMELAACKAPVASLAHRWG